MLIRVIRGCRFSSLCFLRGLADFGAKEGLGGGWHGAGMAEGAVLPLSNPPFLISSPAPVPGLMSIVVCAWATPVISAATTAIISPFVIGIFDCICLVWLVCLPSFNTPRVP